MVYVQGGNVVGSRTENKMRGGFILDFFWGILNGIVLLCVPGPCLPAGLPACPCRGRCLSLCVALSLSLPFCSRALCCKLSGGC